jgi:ATP-independent RNA helicase DbpA
LVERLNGIQEVAGSTPASSTTRNHLSGSRTPFRNVLNMPRRFSKLPLDPSCLGNLVAIGYDAMTPIQAESLPEILKNKDLIVQAKTGSGKTAAFGLGILAKLDPKDGRVQALVLCPTHELAEQVSGELRRLARFLPNIKILTLCGGSPMQGQQSSLEHGAHIVVGTPGRIEKHIRKRYLQLNSLKTLVLDEGDRLLDMGFYDSILSIASATPANRQTLLFSATFPERISEMSRAVQRQPGRVAVDTEHSDTSIRQVFYRVARTKRDQALCSLISHYQPESALIFCNTRQCCKDVTDGLRREGFSVAGLHGDLDQIQRTLVLTQFANRSCSILVATDVAARGLDIDGLAAVINYELSPDPEIHVHRVGRTGRAGKEGLALSLCLETQDFLIHRIEEFQKSSVVWETLDKLTPRPGKLVPPMVTFLLNGGKKNKIRPGDVLGVLTGDAGLTGKDVGKINIFDTFAYVAIARNAVEPFKKWMSRGKLKGRFFRPV